MICVGGGDRVGTSVMLYTCGVDGGQCEVCVSVEYFIEIKDEEVSK